MQKLIDGFHKFHAEVFGARRDFFEALADGQRPETLFITCSDSRINPNLLTQTDPGELFILRNAGNIVPAYSPMATGEAATIEFAVQHLGVRQIVICGHTGCGAMKALLDPELVRKSPAVANWLQHGEAARRHVVDNYQHLSGEALQTVMVEENVLSQFETLRTHPAVRTRLSRGELTVHGWVYKMETGEAFQFSEVSGQFEPLRRPGAEVARDETSGVVTRASITSGRPLRGVVGI